MRSLKLRQVWVILVTAGVPRGSRNSERRRPTQITVAVASAGYHHPKDLGVGAAKAVR